VAAVLATAATAGAEEKSHPRAEPRARTDAASAALTVVNGAVFAWPPIDTPAYAAPDAEPFRRALEERRSGGSRGAQPSREPRSSAALALAADVVYLDAASGRRDFLPAAGLYERAYRDDPDFPDAARLQFMIGQTYLAVGLGPEAGAAFTQVERRFPESPFVLEARLGRAASLRLRRRPAEAATLAAEVAGHVSGDTLCRTRREQALDADTPAAAAAAFRQLATACPTALDDPAVVRDYADALARAGDREGARRVLARGPAAEVGDAAARLGLLAGTLAATPEDARAAYERVLTMHAAPPLVLEAQMHLIRLKSADDPAKAAEELVALAARPGPRNLRAAMLGDGAEMMVGAGRFEDALGLLDRSAALGPEGEAQADGRRPEILGRWIAALGAHDDDAGIATVYAAYTTAIHESATVDDRLAIARALGRLGLHASAVRLLEVSTGRAPDPALALALAEEALAAGDAATARTNAARLVAAKAPAGLVARAHVVGARAALALGDVEAAATEAAAADDATLRADVGRALLARPGGAAAASALLEPALAAADVPVSVVLVAAAAASVDGAWESAARLYGQALARATGAERTEAAAGVARAARARGDDATANAALAELRPPRPAKGRHGG